MRKTIILGTLITLFGAGALAQARDITTTEIGSTTEAARPAERGEEYAHERHHESRRGHHEYRRGHRERHDEAHERHDERWEHGRRHH
ncbi:hypothetical protein KMZ93_25995 [Bradyrhizobium sediminis]|uniref:Uncharacterized protein n=1 Tax=Bradyrhizobium sediminis TaxID=2840469 RepID=A0A975RXN1_9BRAD|nr:hypothetical protein [Bradyrhizobium sediminis]QWG23338.1 hypothetical protein KMZ93_25995 [Bradyrhizobium sediminis]